MREKHLRGLHGALWLAAIGLGTCTALHAQDAAPSPPASAADAAVAPAAAAQPTPQALRRAATAKAELTRKAARKPKAERDGATIAWQNARGTPTREGAFDQPQSAQIFFLEKRLPAGQTTLSPEMYRNALQQSARMPVYSSQEGRFVTGTRQPASIVTRSSEAAQALSRGTSPDALGVWQALGPGNIGGRTRSLVIHPGTPATMWAGSVAGGIWKTTDGGATWVPKADLLVNMAVNTLVLDARTRSALTLYAGTGEGFFNGDAVRGAGILKSTDSGETWAQLPSTANADFYYVQKIVISPLDGNRVYAATRAGVLRSTDGGASWTKVIDAASVNGCMDLAIQTDRRTPNVFASCGTFTQATVYRSQDTAAGAPWVSVMSVANQGRTSLAIAPSNQNIVYALAASNETGNFNNGLLGVYRSTTSGSAGSFTARVTNTSTTTLNRLLLSNPVIATLTQCAFGTSSFLNQGWYDNIIAVDPKNADVVWVGGIDLFRSDDGGANFGQASHWWFTRGTDPEYNHADQHFLVFHPQYDGVTNKTMFSTNDGGIFKTVDARAPVSYSPDPIGPASPVCGSTPAGVVAWTELNNGYQVTQFYHGAHFPDGSTYFGGTQDNGTLRGNTVSGSNAWSTILGGDGGYVAVNPANTNMLFAENTGLSLQRSTDAGVSWSAFRTGITEATGNFLFIAPFAQNPSNAAQMWIAGATPWRTTSATTVPAPATIWTQAGAFFGQRIGAIAVAPSDATRVYMGGGSGSTANGLVFTTTNALTSTSATVWTSSRPRADATFVSWLAVHPTLPGTVYATISTFNSPTGTGHVFRSTDFGATWTNIDGSGATGIPDVPAHSIVIDPADTNRLYVGTDIGVFVSLDAGATWARENTGFANVIVEALSLKNTAPRYLYAYTHGRSAFRVPLP